MFYQCCIVCASERKYILGIRRFINNITIISIIIILAWVVCVVYQVCDVNVLYGVEWCVVVWCVVCVWGGGACVGGACVCV